MRRFMVKFKLPPQKHFWRLAQKFLFFGLSSYLLLVLGLRVFAQSATPPMYLVGCLDSGGRQTLYNVTFGTTPPSTPTCNGADSPVSWSNSRLLSIAPGTGLTGGGNLGDVSLSLAPNYQLPQGCANEQIGKWNVATGLWNCADDTNTVYTAGKGLNLVGGQFGIADGGVTTAQLANNSITQYAVPVAHAPEFPLTGNGFQPVPGANVTINSTGGPVLLMVTGMVRVDTPGAVVVVSDVSADIEVGGGAAGTRYPFTLQSIYAPPAGANTWQVYANIYGGGVAYVYVKSMIAIELKR